MPENREFDRELPNSLPFSGFFWPRVIFRAGWQIRGRNPCLDGEQRIFFAPIGHRVLARHRITSRAASLPTDVVADGVVPRLRSLLACLRPALPRAQQTCWWTSPVAEISVWHLLDRLDRRNSFTVIL
jgi:hypothetical protein